MKAALVVSGFLILTWVGLMVGVEPASDPNAVLDYIELTFLLVAALALVWLVVVLVRLGRRFARRIAGPS